MKRVGILGGTFDPPHFGHLLLALDAHQDLQLDKILFVVAGQPWQKTVTASAFDRLIMTDLAIHETLRPWAEVSTVEVDRGEQPTYTIDTLEALARDDQELFLLIGFDQVANITTWHRHKEIADYATVHPVPRSLGISSSAIRSRVSEGKRLKYMVPDTVIEYIEKTGLYK